MPSIITLPPFHPIISPPQTRPSTKSPPTPSTTASPSTPPPLSGLTALITGANGHLRLPHAARAGHKPGTAGAASSASAGAHPQSPTACPPTAEHIPLDFLHVAAVDRVFFFSYIQPAPQPGPGFWSDAEEMTRVNSRLLRNLRRGVGVGGGEGRAVHAADGREELRRPSRSDQGAAGGERSAGRAGAEFLLSGRSCCAGESIEDAE